MFFSFLIRMLIALAAVAGYANAAELPDINGAQLTPSAGQFAVLPAAPETINLASQPAAALPQGDDAGSVADEPVPQNTQPAAALPQGDDAGSVADEPAPQNMQPAAIEPPVAAPAQEVNEDQQQDRTIGAVLQAIRERQLTPLSTECLSMSFIDNSDDAENYLIDVRENRNNPACGGDPETAPHLFYFKANKTDGTLQTDAGVEPEDFYPLEDGDRPAVAGLTAEDFTIQVNGVTLSLGQVWNEDLMMSLPPERAQQQSDATRDAAYRYDRHSYEALTLVASNENWQQRQRSADDIYLREITLINPTLATHRGVRVGMTIDELERKYGHGEADEQQGESWLSWQLDDKTFAARISNGLVTLIRLSDLQPAAEPLR